MLPALVVVALVAAVLAAFLVRALRDSAARQAAAEALEARLATAEAAHAAAVEQRDAARSEAAAADQARAASEAEAVAADERASDAEEARTEAERSIVVAEAASSEAATLAARLLDDGAADPAALWALELQRTERTWRHSVAAVAGDPSPLVGARHPLWTALEIEVAAVREEVGAVVDLDVDLPDVVTPGASLATLRVAQELLAGAARKGEVTTLRVVPDGHDLLVAADSVDADGAPIELAALVLPPSRIEPTPGRIRLVAALQPPPG